MTLFRLTSGRLLPNFQLKLYQSSIDNLLQKSSVGNLVNFSGFNSQFMMDQPRHHAEGESSVPPLIPNSLRFYNMKYCPYAERTLLVLVHKNVNFDLVNINLKKKPSWFLERSPLGKVPSLEKAAGDIVCESLVTMEYLEDQYPEPKTLPSDPWKKAQDKMLTELFATKVISKFFKVFFSKTADDHETVKNDVLDGLDFMEKELEKRGGKFFFGDAPGYVDFSIYPWFERMAPMKEAFKVELLTDRHQRLVSWKNAMLTVPSVKKVTIPDSEHAAFMNMYIAGGEIDYNFNMKK